jgi:hypothetical protein
MYKRVIDIQKALSFPSTIKDWTDGEGNYCAWGGAFEACNEILEGGHISVDAYMFIARLPDRGHGIINLNDKEQKFELARKLAIQTILEHGFAVPAESDLELAKELMSLVKPGEEREKTNA